MTVTLTGCGKHRLFLHGLAFLLLLLSEVYAAYDEDDQDDDKEDDEDDGYVEPKLTGAGAGGEYGAGGGT